MPAEPERFNYDARLMAEAENEKVLPAPLPAQLEAKWGVKWGTRRMDVVSARNRQFFEFEFQTTSNPKVVSLEYIHFSRDLRVMYVIEVPYVYKKASFPPEQVKRMIEGFEPIEKELSAANVAMERGAGPVYALTLDNVVGWAPELPPFYVPSVMRVSPAMGVGCGRATEPSPGAAHAVAAANSAGVRYPSALCGLLRL